MNIVFVIATSVLLFSRSVRCESVDSVYEDIGCKPTCPPMGGQQEFNTFVQCVEVYYRNLDLVAPKDLVPMYVDACQARKTAVFQKIVLERLTSLSDMFSGLVKKVLRIVQDNASNFIITACLLLMVIIWVGHQISNRMHNSRRNLEQSSGPLIYANKRLTRECKYPRKNAIADEKDDDDNDSYVCSTHQQAQQSYPEQLQESYGQCQEMHPTGPIPINVLQTRRKNYYRHYHHNHHHYPQQLLDS